MLLVSEGGTVLDGNDAACAWAGRARSDWHTGETLAATVVGVDGSPFSTRFTLAAELDGGVRLFAAQPSAEASGAPTAYLNAVTDGLSSLVSYLTPDLHFRYANQQYVDWFGLDPRGFVGKHAREVLGFAAFEVVRPLLERALAGEQVRYQRLMPYRHGPPRFVRGEFRPQLGPDGQVVGIVTQVTDVTDLHNAEERFRAAAESSFDAIFVFESIRDEAGAVVDFRFVEANAPGERLLGMTRDQLLGHGMCELIPRNREMGAFDRYRKVMETRVPLEEEFGECAAGHVDSWFHQQVVPLKDGIAITVRDMTARMRAERQQQDSERRFRAFMDNSPALCWVTDEEGRSEYFNPTFERETSLSPGQIIGRKPTDFMPNEHGAAHLEHILEVARTRVPMMVRETAPKQEGTLGTFLVHKFPIETEAGLKVGGIAIDITGQVEAEARLKETLDAEVQARQEIQRLNQELEERVRERTAELEAAVRELEGFTYSVSHDLRSPLRAISSASGMLLEDLGESLPDSARQQLERQAAAALRMGVLIDELLRLSRLSRAPLERLEVDLSALVIEVGEQIGMGLARLEVQPGMRASVDPSLVRFVFQNVIENAVKFSPRGGTIRVGQMGDGAYFVADEGIGFDPKHARRMFEPFQRLVSESEFPGTGIGLANVRRIVERHGGRVWAEGETGRGARIYFTLTPEG